MISRTVIDLLAEEDIKLPADEPSRLIDDAFMPRREGKSLLTADPSAEAQTPGAQASRPHQLSTRKKLDILDWTSIDRQLQSFGLNEIDGLGLKLIDEDTRKHITMGAPTEVFDFGADAIPFAVKYNVAIALSCSEAIGILSHLDTCEIYASEEVESVFRKYGKHIHPGLSRISFDELPLNMKRELVWPIVQNLYRALTIRKAARVFPEGVSGKLAYEALTSECENEQLASQVSHLAALKYSDYKTIYFSDPSDLEVKYHVALYCLNHIGEIKPAENHVQDTFSAGRDARAPGDAHATGDEQQQEENVKRLEEEYVAAFKRINKNRSFWDKVNLEDLFEMGRDVMSAIKEEVKNFAQLKQGIISRLSGRSKVAIENEELLRIIRGRNPDFGFASQYLAMFFQPSDYYGILGLDNSARVTERDVKDAFKRQAKIYHPDKNSDDPNKDQKEQRFKLLIEAKDALLKKLRSGRKVPSGFRDDASLISYLGRMSKLFEEYTANQPAAGITADQDARPTPGARASCPHPQHQEEAESAQDTYNPLDPPLLRGKGDQEGVEMQTDENITQDSASEDGYFGPYFEEMRILESMIDGWVGKEVLILGVGREPDDFSIPVILTQLGANVSAIDVNYRGPAEYQGCQYYRVSADRVDGTFAEEQFDIVISTAMFGVPFTNWATREYALNPFYDGFKDRIKELEIEVLGRLLKLTKKGGIHFHYNRDLNPQSWNFGEDDLKQMGCDSAFHPQDLPNPRETWFLRK